MEASVGIQARNLINDLTKLKPKLPFAHSRRKTGFLTSITGFLGSQILRSLLHNPEVEHIIGLVRAQTEEEARERVEAQAKLGKWWNPSFFNRIEVWLGDLGKSQLGLDSS
jgi:thioester reductase-like protein